MVVATTNCPQCGYDRMPVGNKFCSAKCYKEHFGYKAEDSISVVRAVEQQFLSEERLEG